jgi:hypothetical protein
VVVAGDGAGDLEFGFGDADAVLDEEDLLGAAVEDLEAAIVVPWRGRSGVGLFVLKKFYGHGSERRGGEVAGDVSEAAVGGTDFAILHFEQDGGLAGDLVGDVSGANGDENVIVAMAVQQSGGVRRDVHLKDAHVLILQSQVVERLGGDFDFCGLGGESDREQQEGAQSKKRFHDRNSNRDGTAGEGAA